MNINPINVGKTYMKNLAKTGGAAPVAGVGSIRSKQDTISITGEASSSLELKKVTDGISRSVNDSVSPQRLAELKGQIESGEYRVPTDKLVDAIMRKGSLNL